MNNIVFDFRHAYTRGDRLQAAEDIYQWDAGRIIEAYVPEEEPEFVFAVGYDNDLALTAVSATVDAAEDGGFVLTADMPVTLDKPGTILVYIVAEDDGIAVTLYEGAVKVRYRQEVSE